MFVSRKTHEALQAQLAACQRRNLDLIEENNQLRETAEFAVREFGRVDAERDRALERAEKAEAALAYPPAFRAHNEQRRANAKARRAANDAQVEVA